MRQTTFLAGLTAAAALTLFAGPGVASAQSRERDSGRRGLHGRRSEQDQQGQQREQGKWGQRGRDNENDDVEGENDDHDDDDGVRGGSVRRNGTGTGQCVNVNGQTYCDNSRTNGGRGTGQCVNVNGQLYCDNSGVYRGNAGENDYNSAQRLSTSGRHDARGARRGRGARGQSQVQLGRHT